MTREFLRQLEQRNFSKVLDELHVRCLHLAFLNHTGNYSSRGVKTTERLTSTYNM